ncbi:MULTISPECIES: calcium-binding protein [unclassified Pseudomonas]|uniref:beta strand repeat-containing protein n=2 Tax=Pseudomonas TaxID=286 RepID=UPI0008774BD1|nr:MULTISPECIES: calcium-binding protein [unclassified Pseudomonas]SCZ28287.1 Hemolysin-type calcium-binding repeat-containing protein [Pseudomonas sp. NFACC44-2]SFH46332.1 Hemolysin-type calcium-binding repeat-containing protein [Pseudomonas sp. NFACC54]SFT14309.1 Hemolysin-type calcium-binding repeat-containing protein [Pseudomonas sp. NFACC48-1]
MAVINGTSGADTLAGSSDDDEVYGLASNDVLLGSTGADRLDGGTGVDTVDYSASTAAIDIDIRNGVGRAGVGGDAEGDTLVAVEKVIGTAFDDSFTSTIGNLTFEGGAGNDIYNVATSGVKIIEQADGGIDELRTSWTVATMDPFIEKMAYTGSGNFTGYGNASDNIIIGGVGTDVLFGGDGADQFFGGAGLDVAGYTDSKVAVTINLKTGVHSGIAAGDTFTDIEVIRGTGAADTFVADGRAIGFDGGAGIDTVDYSTSAEAINVDIRVYKGLPGTGGDAEGDTLEGIEKVIGTAFNDTFTSAWGAVTMEGGAGDDLYTVNTSGNKTIELADGGYDEVRTNQATFTLNPFIEKLSYTGTASFTAYGNASDNIIIGGAGNDVLFGGDGADQLFGGEGLDVAGYTDSKVAVNINLKTGVHSGIATGDTFTGIEVIRGSNLNDTFVADGRAIGFDGGAGVDTVDYSTSAEAINVDIRVYKGLPGIGGDAEGDTLEGIEKVIGTAFNDTFTSAWGAVTMEGGAGDDLYTVNTSGNKTVELADGGFDEVRTNQATFTLNPFIEKLTYTGTAAFTAYGSVTDNIIIGGAGNDVLFGGDGADQLFGGEGLDVAGYTDSKVAVNINLKTGVHSGIATGDTFTDIEVIRGSNLNDTFVADGRAIGFDGGAGVDTVDYSTSAEAINVDIRVYKGLPGTGGDAEGDTLEGIEKVIGTAFNDTFTSAWGAVTMEGGAGDDLYTVNTSGNKTIELADGGFDEVRTNQASYRMDPFIEKLTYTGTAAFTAYGNASENIIIGGAGNDVLFGGDGADQFFGGSGLDVAGYTDSSEAMYINLKTGVYSGIAVGDTFTDIEVIRGSNLNDTFVADGLAIGFDGGLGIDTVDYSTSAEAINVDIRVYKGLPGIGGDADGDTLEGIEKVIGTVFNDTFTSAWGAVTLEGGLGDDVYIVNTSGNKTVELADGGFDEVFTNQAIFTMDPFIEKMTHTGTVAFTGYGNTGDNIIIGGGGNDVLFGAAGADQLIGGAGVDVASYGDSRVAVTLNMTTGVHSGIAAGDTYQEIETLRGSGFNDTFIGGSQAMGVDGALGTDLASYEQSSSAVTIDLTTNVNAGDAAGDTFTAIEIYQGSDFDDTLLGSAKADIFIGGAGADVIDGRDGVDQAWYINSAAAVDINLQTGIHQGGDAQGDVLTNIERVMGSQFNDSMTGDSLANWLEGGLGNDTIYGGDGADYIYGGLYTATGPMLPGGPANVAQADQLYGGLGNDALTTANLDTGAVAYGEAGNDGIAVFSGTADGGAGNDILLGRGDGFRLLGGAGDDTLTVAEGGQGFVNGGQDDDTYVIDTYGQVTIKDDGTGGFDRVLLNGMESMDTITTVRSGNDAYIFNTSSYHSGQPLSDMGVKLQDWYAGFNTIEQFHTSNGDVFTIPA